LPELPNPPWVTQHTSGGMQLLLLPAPGHPIGLVPPPLLLLPPLPLVLPPLPLPELLLPLLLLLLPPLPLELPPPPLDALLLATPLLEPLLPGLPDPLLLDPLLLDPLLPDPLLPDPLLPDPLPPDPLLLAPPLLAPPLLAMVPPPEPEPPSSVGEIATPVVPLHPAAAARPRLKIAREPRNRMIDLLAGCDNEPTGRKRTQNETRA
jgi:hypothetical protein